MGPVRMSQLLRECGAWLLVLVFCGGVWSAVWRLGAEATASHAKRENPWWPDSPNDARALFQPLAAAPPWGTGTGRLRAPRTVRQKRFESCPNGPWYYGPDPATVRWYLPDGYCTAEEGYRCGRSLVVSAISLCVVAVNVASRRARSSSKVVGDGPALLREVVELPGSEGVLQRPGHRQAAAQEPHHRRLRRRDLVATGG
jgi:hypothetical protein